jgi:endonuclease/exonuclease/phosphatase family metal-dependent hydrolase
MKPTFIAIASLFVLAGCSDNSLAGPAADPPAVPLAADRADGSVGLVVMTRNLYVGADVDQVIGALVSPDPADDQPALLAAIQTLNLTDFPTRAKALAGEIERARPHAIGLQEVSTIAIDLSPLGVPVTIQQDFLATLLAELAARGLDYRPAATVTNIQATPLPFVSLTDRDALLYDHGRAAVAGTPLARTFAQNIGPIAPGVTLVRGFVAADLSISGRTVTVASTHLESGNQPGFDLLRAAQAAELAQTLAANGPVVILGDLNDQPGSPMYQVLAGAGYTDLWAAFGPARSGFTCCSKGDLSNAEPTFVQRIDYVFTRGIDPRGSADGAVRLVGQHSRDRVPGPLYPIWPSDHAGIVANLRFAPAGGPPVAGR